MSEWLGVELWEGRKPQPRSHRIGDFPMLRDQMRCLTGFKHVPGGVLRLSREADDAGWSEAVSPSATPAATPPAMSHGRVEPVTLAIGLPDKWLAIQARVNRFEDLPSKPNRTSKMFEALTLLANAGSELPRIAVLGSIVDPKAGRYTLSQVCLHALRSLMGKKLIQMWEGEKVLGTIELPRAVRLHDGKVLRNDLTPASSPQAWRQS